MKPALLERVKDVTGWLGAVAAASIGIGTLAFSAGFLAQRVQFQQARLPFVFIDYGAYVEAGLGSLLETVVILVASPWPITGAVALVLLAVLSIELEAVRRILRSVGALGVATCLVGLTAAAILHQQVVLLRSPSEGANRSSEGKEPVVLPVTGLFRPVSGRALEAPKVEGISWPATSFDAWTAIASELEARAAKDLGRWSLYPRPPWALLTTDKSSAFMGVHVEDEQLDRSRAVALYRGLVFTTLCAVFALFGLLAWIKSLRADLAASAPSVSGIRRFREEVWYATGRILAPMVGTMLLVAFCLMPAVYGRLVSGYVGQEFVQVVTRLPVTAEKDSPIPPKAPQSDESDHQTLHKARTLLVEYNSAVGLEQRRKRASWFQMLEEQEARGRSGLPLLRQLADLSRSVAPDLTPAARASVSRASARTEGVRTGFLLHYPRSETATLRLLEWRPESVTREWAIEPIPAADVIEVRVRSDEKSLALAALLRKLSEMDSGERGHELFEAEALGHPRIAEVVMAAILDPSPQVRGAAATRLGTLSAAFAQSGAEEWTRGRATALLIKTILSSDLPDIRSAAITSLYRLAKRADPEACRVLGQVLSGASGGESEWELRGYAITAAGKLACVGCRQQVIDILRDRKTPLGVRAASATSLRMMGPSTESVSVLAELLGDATLPARVAGPVISAIGDVSHSPEDRSRAASALDKYARDLIDGEGKGQRDAAGEWRDNCGAVVGALEELADRKSLETLKAIGSCRDLGTVVRRRAVEVTGSMEIPASAEWLFQLAEDAREEIEVRAESVASLGNFAEEEGIDRLNKLHDEVSAGSESAKARMQEAILDALQARHDEGSGRAGLYVDRRRREARAPATVAKPAESSFDEQIAGERPVLVEFSAKWCGWCRKMRPVLDEFKAAGVVIVEVDIDEQGEIAERYGVTGVPARMLCAKGVCSRVDTGFKEKGDLRDVIVEGLRELREGARSGG